MRKVDILVLVFALLLAGNLIAQTDPLPSWNDGKAKQSIVNFVKSVTTTNSKDFVPEAKRVATFDNDGTKDDWKIISAAEIIR